MLARAEWIFLTEAGMAMGAAKHLPIPQQSDLIIGIMTNSAVATAELRGHILDHGCVGTSIRRQMGLCMGNRCVQTDADGVAEMTVGIVQGSHQWVDRRMLSRWSQILSEAEKRNSAPAGQTADYSALARRSIRHAAQRQTDTEKELEVFLRWFANMDGEAALSPLVRAGVTHLWFERLHPLPSANGRIGRALAEAAIMRGLPASNYTPLSPSLLQYRHEYYQMLDSSCREKDITEWLLWFAALIIEAGRHTQAEIDFALKKKRCIEALRDEINSRQEKALLHLLHKPTSQYANGMIAEQYRAITGADAATTHAELKQLVDLKALLQTTAANKEPYYVPALQPPQVARVHVDDIL